MSSARPTPKTGINYFNLSGTVLKKKFKFSGNGNAFVSVHLKVPAKNPKFSTSLWLKAFKDVAQQINDGVEEQSTYSFTGYISNSSFEKDGEKVWRTDFIINKFQVAEPQEESSGGDGDPSA